MHEAFDPRWDDEMSDDTTAPAEPQRHDPAKVSTLRRRPRPAGVLDPITALALQRIREAHPHARLLALTGWTMAELAKRVEPPVSRSRLADVFAQAEAYGRMSQAWADRLARAVGVEAPAVLELFGVVEPSRNGRPRVRRSA
ncbi:hypothetical protein [Roseisolibacter agri]|uniref:Uncharacterized protein n=1 Tax=Roseisolibacter agri TaxID=2014610 RepID=A0AA37QJX0_9BACT|nr:hypothetical protein [Roseisolibacter agri]GLC28263.1 hypothetical protein rosag_47760 [Roseisolibacter agri]